MACDMLTNQSDMALYLCQAMNDEDLRDGDVLSHRVCHVVESVDVMENGIQVIKTVKL